MSRGYAGVCRIEVEDKQTAIYSYRGENWNLPKEERAKLEAEEGLFTIAKSCFVDPETHETEASGTPGRSISQTSIPKR